MKMQNTIAAQVMGKIIANGMNMCDFNLSGEVDKEAIERLDNIRRIINSSEISDSEKLEKIRRLIM